MRTHGLLLAVAFAVGAFAAFGTDIYARPVARFSTARLIQEADLIVVAVPVSSEDTPDGAINNPGWETLVGVNTLFKVQGVLKGEHKAELLTLLHYRVKDSGQRLKVVSDGPCLATFHVGGLRLQSSNKSNGIFDITVPLEYLLYLKKRKDGRYEPTTGQVDSEFSVREMSSPGVMDGVRRLSAQ